MNHRRNHSVNPIITLVIVLPIATTVVAGCNASGPARGPQLSAASDPPNDTPDKTPTSADQTRPSPTKRWHFDFGLRNSYPKLDSTEQQLDRRLDLPLWIDVAPVFDEPYTPIDRKSDSMLTSWFAGVGRQENQHFLWSYYVGGGADKDINHQRFLFQTLEVDFKYAYAYTGFMGEYYPWEVPPRPSAVSFENVMRASRPFLFAGLESGYLSGEGEGDYKVLGLTFYHDEQKVRDWLFSIAVGLGWAFPLNDHWSINLVGDYRFQFYRPDEYNGWDIIAGIRYRF